MCKYMRVTEKELHPERLIMKVKLNEIKNGERCVIEAISPAVHEMEKRLRALGFTSGVQVEKTMNSPLGDPSAYLVRGSVIALRNSDAARITVTTEKKDEK